MAAGVIAASAGAAADPVPTRVWVGRRPVLVLAAGAALAACTLAIVRPFPNSAAYASVQFLLVLIAGVDLASRRIPNVYVAAIAAIAVACRAFSDPSLLAQGAIVAVICLTVGYGLEMVAKGGFGAGDANLIGAFGLLFAGEPLLEVLLIGSGAGAIAAGVLFLRHGAAARKEALPYGPFLVLGAAAGILFLGPHPLL